MIRLNDKSTRRAALRQIAGTATAAGGILPILGQNPPPESHHSSQPVTKQAAAYTYQFFKPEQLEILDALGETIIPADSHSPGARAAHVSEYIDTIVAGASAQTKSLWTDGLRATELAARQTFQKSYGSCSAHQQAAVLAVFAANERQPVSPEEKFFGALKRATIDGYYTSAIGIHEDLQYQGNQAVASFPGCQHNHDGVDRS